MPTVADHTPYATLLPPTGWQMDPQTFTLETERNDGVGTRFSWPGWSSLATDEVPPVGIVGELGYILEGSTVTTRSTGTIATTDAWPHGLVSRYVLRLNAQATPWNIRGQDLDVLNKARYRNITNAQETSTVTTSGVGGTTDLRVVYMVPLAMDPALSPNTGGLFAQSVNSQIVSEITTAAQSDVVTLTGDGTLAISSATFRRVSTWFSIPTGKLRDGSTGMILPDLSVLHGAISQDVPITATGELVMDLNRVIGTVARLWVRLKNGSAASIDPVTGVDYYRFMYASNQQPRYYDPTHVAWLNERWYRGPLSYDAISIADALAENLARDAVDVENLSNPQVVAAIDSGVTVNAGARAHITYEMLAPLA